MGGAPARAPPTSPTRSHQSGSAVLATSLAQRDRECSYRQALAGLRNSLWTAQPNTEGKTLRISQQSIYADRADAAAWKRVYGHGKSIRALRTSSPSHGSERDYFRRRLNHRLWCRLPSRMQILNRTSCRGGAIMRCVTITTTVVFFALVGGAAAQPPTRAVQRSLHGPQREHCIDASDS